MVGFLCLLMGDIQWGKGERFYAAFCYVLGALSFCDAVAELFWGRSA